MPFFFSLSLGIYFSFASFYLALISLLLQPQTGNQNGRSFYACVSVRLIPVDISMIALRLRIFIYYYEANIARRTRNDMRRQIGNDTHQPQAHSKGKGETAEAWIVHGEYGQFAFRPNAHICWRRLFTNTYTQTAGSLGKISNWNDFGKDPFCCSCICERMEYLLCSRL